MTWSEENSTELLMQQNGEKAGEEEKHDEDGEDTEGQLEQGVECVRLTVTMVEGLGG